MESIEFWRANGALPFSADFTTWNIRYTGTLADFERYEAQIRDGFVKHVTRRGQELIHLSAIVDGDGFIVVGVAR